MEIASGRISGVEALLRWSTPALGNVSPAEFIPLAEENGLILEIGEWVLHTACAQAQAWRAQDVPLARMAVNISSVQFAQRGFVEMVRHALAKTGLDPRILELEITETFLMDNLDSNIETLQAVRDLGVQLAIDDFGTGYSSLSYLKRFPVNRLKIDQAFVRDITSDPNDAAIAIAITEMAIGMNLEVIAEGVENEAQLVFLKEKGCHEVQGHFISRPEPPEAIEKLLIQYKDLNNLPIDHSTTAEFVLILDDDPQLVELFRHILMIEGYQVITPASTREAFDAFAKTRIGVVIADYKMPEMNGTEFLKRIKKISPFTARVMISGKSDAEAIVQAINEGSIYKFLEKPVKPKLLVDTIRQAFVLYRTTLEQEASSNSTKPTDNPALKLLKS